MPLRRRLTLTVLVLLLLGLTCTSITTFGVVRWFAIDHTDKELANDVEGVREVVGDVDAFPTNGSGDLLRELSRNGGLPPVIQVRDTSGALSFHTTSADAPILPRTMTEAKLVGSTEFYGLDAPGTDWRIAGSPLNDGGPLILAAPRTATHAALTQLAFFEAGIAVVVLGLIAVLAGRAVRRDLRPLERMADTAREIAGGDLTRRVSPSESTTEVGRLGVALNVMLGEIEHATMERERSEERLRRFIADASHELRTPVASIRGYSELFRHGAADSPEDLARAMRRIESETERMSVMVDEMLLLARLDQGRPLERDLVDLTVLAADAIADSQAVEPDRPLRLDTTGNTEVHGDAGRLRQVLANLLTNVRQHTPPETPATIRVLGSDDDVVVEISDQGPGLTAEQRERVFERFYRSEPPRMEGGGSAGLGLSIVAAVAEAHGGEASTVVRQDSGATFVVRIPKHST